MCYKKLLDHFTLFWKKLECFKMLGGYHPPPVGMVVRKNGVGARGINMNKKVLTKKYLIKVFKMNSMFYLVFR